MTAEEIQRNQEAAAWRALDILTQWQRENPWSFYKTEYVGKGKFKLTIQNNITEVAFYGETIQDAYAQAASTISLNSGIL